MRGLRLALLYTEQRRTLVLLRMPGRRIMNGGLILLICGQLSLFVSFQVGFTPSLPGSSNERRRAIATIFLLVIGLLLSGLGLYTLGVFS